MTSIRYAFLANLRRAALAAGLLAAFATIAAVPSGRDRLADEVVVEEPAPPPPQTRPVEGQTPKRSDQPEERKRSQDGPLEDELLPSGLRLPA